MAIKNKDSNQRLSKILNDALIPPGFRPKSNMAIEAMLETIGGEPLSSDKLARMLRKIKGKEPIGNRTQQPRIVGKRGVTMQTIDYKHKRETELHLASMINTSWYYSMYWDRNECGALSDKGWKQAHVDGIRRLRDLKASYDVLHRFMGEVGYVIDGIVRLEADELTLQAESEAK